MTELKLKENWHFRKINRNHLKWLIKKDKDKYKLYKSLPKGLSSKEIQEVLTNDIADNM